MNTNTEFQIGAGFPFWRWAVVPHEIQHPGIAYHSKADAVAFFEETAKVLPWSTFYLVRRVWRWTGWLPHSEVVIVEKHEPEISQ